MPATLVQSKTAVTPSAVTTLSAVFDAAPTPGNLLVACAGSDTTLTMSSSGWTLAVSAISNTGLYQWYKVAATGESSTVTVTFASDQAEIEIFEFSGMAAAPDRTASSTPGTTTATVSTGTTSATRQNDELAIAAWCRQGAAAVNSLSNSFTQHANISGLGGIQTTMTTAFKDLSSLATVESTATFAASSANPSGLVVIYTVAAPRPPESLDASGRSFPLSSRWNPLDGIQRSITMEHVKDERRGPVPAGAFERFLFPRPTKSLRPPASPEDAYSTAMRALSPLAYWRLSEDQGEVVVLDCVGTSDGTAINDPPHQTAGLLSIGTDKCYDFNGTDERVDIPDAPPLRFTSGDFSVGAWVNTDNMPGVGVWRTIIHKTLGGQGWGLAFNNSRLYANTNSDGNGNTVLVAGTTYFVGFTFVSSAGEIRFFLNGAADGVLTGKGSPGSSTTPLVIGSDSGGGSSYFDGRIDDAFVAPIALSAADWLNLYNIGTGASVGYAATLKGLGTTTEVLNTDFYSQAALNGRGNTSPPLIIDAVVNAPINAVGQMVSVGIVDAVVRSAVNGVGNTVDAAQVTMALASAINAVGKIVGAASVQASVAAAINAIGTLSPSGSVNALAAAQINAIGSMTPTMNVGGAFRSAPNAVGRMITVPIVDAVMSTQPTAVGRITVPLQSVMALIAAAAGKGIINPNLSVLGGAPVFVHPEINLPTPLSIKSDPSSLAMAQAIAQIMLRTDTVVLSIKGNVGILALQERSSGIILATAETTIALKPETDALQIDG